MKNHRTEILSSSVLLSLRLLVSLAQASPGGVDQSPSSGATPNNRSHSANFWQTSGNAGTAPGVNFLGTTDGQPLELKVNGQRALRLEPNPNGAPNVIGGASANFVASGIVGAVIGGGGTVDRGNEISSHFGVVAGGRANFITSECPGSSIGGGYGNFIDGNSPLSAIGGGYVNYVNLAPEATIAGGVGNGIAASAGAIGGGDNNTIAGGSHGGIIAGGSLGYIHESSPYSVIVGGWQNNVSTNSPFAAILGGDRNEAGARSLAAGNRAKANHTGAFVWGDSTDADVGSTADNQFVARASGGVVLYSNPALSSGVFLPPGGGSWSMFSGRNAKENVKPVDARAVLDKLCAMPLATWNYGSQNKSIRHIGPMAQDFHAAFQVGEDDQHISAVDADGVALAAIQGLNQKLEDRLNQNQTEITSLRRELAELKELVNSLSH